MGFPMRKAAARTAFIGVMLGGGLLYAGISQAQDAGGLQAERSAELIAAAGGPASNAHLIGFNSDRAAVEARDDDVAPLSPQSEASAPAPVSDSAAAVEPVQAGHVTSAVAVAYTPSRR